MDEPQSFLFLSANTPWVYALANRLAESHSVHAVRLFDWNVYWSNRPDWPTHQTASGLNRTTRVMPTGYAGSLEPLFRGWMKHMIRKWGDQLEAESGHQPIVVAPYPYLAPWLRDIPSSRLVYYNLDDYALYRPEQADRIQSKEDELIHRARTTLCLSKYQVRALQGRHPDRTDHIHHFPLGVTEAFLNPEPNARPNPNTVGYVGNLSDRVDWAFVKETVEKCPSLTFRFVGRAEPNASSSPWERDRRATFQYPNVEYVGLVPQEQVTHYYWSSSINWIPYNTDHPFNRASCPTKIMDGIASGRPIISTDVPECRLYPDWIQITQTPDETAKALRNARDDDHDAKAQVEFAAIHTWSERADTFVDHVSLPSHARLP